jgi:hypothetical protein
MTELGKLLVVFGAVLALLGGALVLVGLLGGQMPFLGRLPGDVHIERGGWSLYVPLTTSIVLSVVLTLVLSLIFRR